MKKTLYVLLFSLLTIALNAQKLNFANKQFIVKFKTDLNKNIQTIVQNQRFYIPTIDQLNVKNNLSKIKLIGNKKIKRTFTLFFENDIDVLNVIKQYQKTNLFEFVEPNYIGGIQGKLSPDFVPNDTWTYPWQWSLDNDGTFADATSTVGADISMYDAWDIEQGNPNIIVATLDSGLFVNHQEFNGRIWANPTETFDGTDSDGNGLVDDVNGWSYFDDTNNISDVNGHGTNVTGIIGANGNNGIGYAGIDWNCKLMTLKVLDDSGSGFYSWWSDAIHYAVDHGANVINMSLTGSNPSSVLENAMNYAFNNNVVVIVATGNSNGAIGYPAAYPTAIAIGATDTQDNRANPFAWGGGSNYGPEIDLVAPGNRIYGLNPDDDTNFSWYWSGTSQATPHVTGVASLLLAQNQNLTPNEIKTILQDTADDQVGLATEDIAGFDNYYGHGRLNAHQALLQGTANTNDLENKLFSVYPNPVTNDILHINNLNTIENYKISIFNALGELVYSNTINNTNSSININKLTSGVYFVNLNNKTNNYTQKFIKE